MKLNEIRDFSNFESERVTAFRNRVLLAYEKASEWQREEFDKFLLAIMEPKFEEAKMIPGVFYDQGLFYLSNEGYQFINGLARKAVVPLFAKTLKRPLKPIYSTTVSLSSMMLLMLCLFIEAERKHFGQWWSMMLSIN